MLYVDGWQLAVGRMKFGIQLPQIRSPKPYLPEMDEAVTRAMSFNVTRKLGYNVMILCFEDHFLLSALIDLVSELL